MNYTQKILYIKPRCSFETYQATGTAGLLLARRVDLYFRLNKMFFFQMLSRLTRGRYSHYQSISFYTLDLYQPPHTQDAIMVLKGSIFSGKSSNFRVNDTYPKNVIHIILVLTIVASWVGIDLRKTLKKLYFNKQFPPL